MTCDRCGETATHIAWGERKDGREMPFDDGFFGLLLCDSCLSLISDEYRWDAVEPLEAT